MHRHKWEAVDAEQGEYTNFDGGMGTIVLYRCSHCKKVKTEIIDGHWTLTQLTGKPRSGGGQWD